MNSSSYWQNKRVLVTGGHGFLGREVVGQLQVRGCEHVITPSSKEYDLREKLSIVELLRSTAPDIIIHLAAVVGGIGANRSNPGRFFYENAIMGIELIEQARRSNMDLMGYTFSP
jgi:GDP-L-fucose synthase